MNYFKLDTENRYIFSLTPDFENSEKFPENIETTEIFVIYKGFKFKIDDDLRVTFIGENDSTANLEKQLEKEALVLLEHFDDNNGIIIKSDKITTHEKKVGDSSLFLNDTEINDSSTSKFEFNSDFTIEYWTKIASENLNYEWAIHLAVNTNNGIYLGFNRGKYIVRGWGVQTYLTVEPPPMDKWVHIAVTRKNGNLKVFYDGVLQGSVQNNTNFANGNLCIGYEGTAWHAKNSYMDELKISPNLGKYEDNFNVNESITDSNDIIYHFEKDDVLQDSTATQSMIEKKMGISSYYFDNSCVIYKEKEGFKLSGDFTIDYWVNQNSENLNKNWAVHLAVHKENGIYLALSNGKYIVRGWGIENYLTLDPPPMEEWVHIAVTRKNGILYVFYNGILQGQTENTTEFSKGNLCIGYEGTSLFITKTYIDELRILNGYCQWTENFTVPNKSYEY